MSPRPSRIIISTAIICLAAGFGAGWWLGRENPSKSNSTRRPLTLTEPAPGSKTPLAGSAAPASRSRIFDGPPATERKAATAQFRDALRTLDRLERMKNMLTVLDKMTPENGQVYLDGWLDYVNQNTPPPNESPLFDRKIGEVLGPVVVGRRTGTTWDMSRVRDAVRNQFIGWMHADPAAAKTWMDGLKNEEFREKLVDAYVSATAQQNVDSALAFLQTLPDDLQGRSAAVIVEAVKAEKSQEDLGAWMKDVAARAGDKKDAAWLHATGDALMQSLVSARMVGPSAAAIYEEHQGQPYLDAAWGVRLAGAYARSDAAGGLAWAAKMSADGNPRMLNAATAGLLPEKLDEALQWAQTSATGSNRVVILNQLAARFAETDPAKAKQIESLVTPPAP